MTDRIWVETRGIDALIEHLKDNPERMRVILRASANKALRSSRTQVKRTIAKNVGVAQKHIKNRIYFRSAKKGAKADKRGSTASVWVGLNPLPATATIFERLREDEDGAWAKKYFFPEGFVQMAKKSEAIYQRITEEPLPIEMGEVVTDTPETRQALEQIADDAFDVFEGEVTRLAGEDWEELKRKMGRKDRR